MDNLFRRTTSRIPCSALMCVVWMVVVILSGSFLLCAFAFATMVPKELHGWKWWSTVLWKTFRFPYPGIATWTTLFIFLAGNYYLICTIIQGKMYHSGESRQPEQKGDTKSRTNRQSTQ